MTKRERRGFSVLLFLLILVYLLLDNWPEDIPEVHWQPLDSANGYEYTKNELHNVEADSDDGKSTPEKLPGGFYFDPNETDSVGWRQIGLDARVTRTLMNYRRKGGKFRAPEDIRKIYGLSEIQKEALLSWVRIKENSSLSHLKNKRPFDSSFRKSQGSPFFVKKSFRTIEINSSDSTHWISLPGIGPGYCRRILKFREKLGGFVTINQVGETFGLPDSVFQSLVPWMKCDPSVIRKIRLNQWPPDSLDQHPYIDKTMARSLVEFRSRHGPFQQIDDLRKVWWVKDEWLSKMRPYLSLE